MDWFSIGLSVVALLWLAFREIAPKTSWKWDDKLVNMLDGVSETVGVEPKDLLKRGAVRRKSKKSSSKDV